MRKLLIAAAAISLVGLGIFAWIGASNQQAFIERGPWGDFFGGVANPILTFLTFICVLGTLYLQHQELGLSRRELARSAKALESQNDSMAEQKKQNIFFQMLSLHNQIIESIDLHHGQNKALIAKGRDSFSRFYTRLAENYKKEVEKGIYSDAECILRAYNTFWNKHQLELGHYYRFLYRMAIFTDKEFSNDDYYMGILRAQISDQELLLLFYNALTPQGESFKPLIERWALFDNLPAMRLLSHSDRHKTLFAETAYSSRKAQQFRLEEPKD
jgi:hypothetical protein